MEYPHRTDAEQAALDRIQSSPFSTDDMPFLNMARYSTNGYEAHHLKDKALVDRQGRADNLWWLHHRKGV